MTAAMALFLGSAVVIYLACEFFVNGVEWLGRKLNVSQTATGTVLAAFGTALPESVVTIVAVTTSDSEAQSEIGIGAALGGPLVLSTIAYAVVGFTLWLNRHKLGREPLVEVNHQRLSRDQGWFLLIFAFKIALGLVAFSVKPWLGLLFLVAYALYFWNEMRGGAEEEEGELGPLRIRPGSGDPWLGWALLQTALSLATIFAASRVFVSQLEVISPWLGIPPQVTALLRSPVATELPETLNAVIWVRQGKERLALANISGAMMIQATVPTAFAIFFTSWLLDPSLIVAAGVTAMSVVVLFFAFRDGRVTGRGLTSVGLLYPVFAALLIAVM
jgi:cation:H+ antiporter